MAYVFVPVAVRSAGRQYVCKEVGPCGQAASRHVFCASPRRAKSEASGHSMIQHGLGLDMFTATAYSYTKDVTKKERLFLAITTQQGTTKTHL